MIWTDFDKMWADVGLIWAAFEQTLARLSQVLAGLDRIQICFDPLCSHVDLICDTVRRQVRARGCAPVTISAVVRFSGPLRARVLARVPTHRIIRCFTFVTHRGAYSPDSLVMHASAGYSGPTSAKVVSSNLGVIPTKLGPDWPHLHQTRPNLADGWRNSAPVSARCFAISPEFRVASTSLGHVPRLLEQSVGYAAIRVGGLWHAGTLRAMRRSSGHTRSGPQR